MKYLFSFLCLTLVLPAFSQTTVGLVGYYTFDGIFTDITGNSANEGTATGNPSFDCGVKGDAIVLDGIDDLITIKGDAGSINDEFSTEDFTISFYFKPVGMSGTPYLLSKRSEDCLFEQYFFIRYSPLTRIVNGVLTEDMKVVSVARGLDYGTCWQHVALARDKNKLILYINGKFAAELGTSSRVDIFNDGDFTIGGGNCRNSSEPLFSGLIDELRIYNRALDEEEVAGLYFAPDKIAIRDTLIFLGREVDIKITSSCATAFQWIPALDISSSSVAEPTIKPSFPASAPPLTYTVNMVDQVYGCIATDSINITVIDPDLLDCRKLYLPRAFTPNGDGLNDTYGISNPFSVQELISFEIFDRWGSRLFSTQDPFEHWDGYFKGEKVNSGVFLFKLRYVCNQIERFDSGNLTIIR
ncbi:MAG: LamG-like jellyroll fold domain-containing protein [Saprospiraceae bacterium]